MSAAAAAAAAARFDCASDQTLLVSFGDEIAPEANRQVRALLDRLQADPVAGTRNLHPAYSSLLVKFDPSRTTHAQVERAVRERLARSGAAPAAAPRQVEIPVCYGQAFGPDLAGVAESQHLKVDDVVRIHSQQTYTVFFLGFAPGFAYLGMVPEAIAVPRLAVPRRRVEAGSVGIAGEQTGIYPCPVPGGWQIIGRTPRVMFRPDREPMALLQAGDEVRFRPIGPDEFERIQGRGE